MKEGHVQVNQSQPLSLQPNPVPVRVVAYQGPSMAGELGM